MTDQQKKQKEIAIAFGQYYADCDLLTSEYAWQKWLLTEEGKRLTAEE